MELAVWVWSAVVLFFVLLELSQPGLFYFLSISIGSVAALVGLGFGLGINLQLAIFLTITLASCAGLKFFVWRFRSTGPQHRTNVDALIGMVGVVIALPEIPLGLGLVQLAGETWSARPVHGLLLTEGQRVQVVAVSGCHVVVKLVDIV